VSPAALPTVNLIASELHVVAGEVIYGTNKGVLKTKFTSKLRGSQFTVPILS
jgi:hypothetical protein